MVEARSFRIWGAIYAVATFLTWIYIVIRVIHRQFEMERFYWMEATKLETPLGSRPTSTSAVLRGVDMVVPPQSATLVISTED